MDKAVISEKNSLEDDKKNIIKISKTKIMDSISNQRKIKDQYQKESSSDKQLIQQLKKEIEQYKNILKETKTKVTKLEEENNVLSIEVNALKELALPFEELLEKELLNVQKNKDNFILCMIGIDNFNSLKNKLYEFTTIENFILGILKYLKNSLRKTDTFIYFEAEIFYILMPDYTLERAVSVAKTLGKRRTINQQHITLSAGLTQIKEDDTSDSIITRCLESYNEAINDATHSRILYNE